MFDRDEHARFTEAVNLAKSHGIELAISNPCFELWAILHYEWVDAPIDRKNCQARLTKLCPNYSTSSKNYADKSAIQSAYDCALSRARRLVARRCEEGTPLGNPSTTAFELTERLLHSPR